MLKDDALLEAVEKDWRSAPLDEKRITMVAFAIKLTVTPGDMTSADTESLRSAGFSDRDILDITEVAAYYAYANRIADGLGIEIESWVAE